MGRIIVDQIGSGGELLQAADVTISNRTKTDLLLAALPGATEGTYAGEGVVRFEDQILLKKQVTHLGHPWPGFKKRIQIPHKWLEVERQATKEGLTTRFVGIYHSGQVTIFVDFDPLTYIRRKANNSAAHVSTNDLFQAQTIGLFSRTDRNGNRLTSLRPDQFAAYLQGRRSTTHPRVSVFEHFNDTFLRTDRLDALDAVRAMHAESWPDTFQGEWPGFYLEFRLASFILANGLDHLVEHQKVKGKGAFDYDLAFRTGSSVEFYGDLKASNVDSHEAPGNDAEDIARCVAQFGRFWYVIYEHETTHSRDNGDRATRAWNEWRRSVGHGSRKEYNPLSYARRFKESVHFTKMSILEVNEANFDLALSGFAQGRQPDGSARALKVMINKKNVDNFLIYSDPPGSVPGD